MLFRSTECYEMFQPNNNEVATEPTIYSRQLKLF